MQNMAGIVMMPDLPCLYTMTGERGKGIMSLRQGFLFAMQKMENYIFMIF